jgi:hypothetical protein
MLRIHGSARSLLAAAALVAAGCAVVATAPAASASTPGGTILYVRNDDVWQATPDLATTWQVTHNGATPTTDGTGSTGYQSVSESDNGVIVAVRNQRVAPGYDQGWIWVMDRTGRVLRKFEPPQWSLYGSTSCAVPAQFVPLGIVDAEVSPDGTHIAYVAETYFQDSSCTVHTGWYSVVVNTDGTGATEIEESGSGASIEIGKWVSNTRLLADRQAFGDIAAYYVDLPGDHPVTWMAPSDWIDQAYGQPDVRNGIVATDGYSESSSAPVIRLWTTTGYSTAPVAKCEVTSAVNTGTDEILGRPALAPDGSEVLFQDYRGTADQPDEGLYMLSTSIIADSCAGTQTLFLQGATDPFWSNATITQLPPDLTPPTVALTAPTAAAVASSSVRVSWSGHDDSSGIARYQLRYERAAYNGTFSAWTYPSAWSALTGTTVTAAALAPGYTYCWSVRAVDHAGNTSAWTAPRCTAITLDDRSLSRSSGWSLVTGTAYYLHTATTTKTRGATLSRSTARSLRHVGIVATTCPTCGTVAIYVAGALIGTVNLAASTTHTQVIKLLAAGGRTGTVVLKVTSSGRLVAIDGLVVSHS